MPGDIGFHLVAAATSYMDRTEDEDNNPDTPALIADFIRFDNRAQSDPSAPVIDDPTNAPPEFREGNTAVRYVEENDGDDLPNRAPETIGEPLEIDDDDLPGDSHTWTMSGTDAASFNIDAGTGQLMTKAALDYERKNSYTVVVEAEDGSGESNDTDRITVNIQVKALDEKPVITGDNNVEYREDARTLVVTTLTANDPERVTPTYWSFSADDTPEDIVQADYADNGLFNIEGGELSFKEAPSYEDRPRVDDVGVSLQGGREGLRRWGHELCGILQGYGQRPGRGGKRESDLVHRSRWHRY